jgi:hypothetical protein
VQTLRGLGHSIALGGAYTYAGAAELLAGDPVAAERELRAGLELLESIDETGNLSTLAAVLADAVLRQGRDAEADELTRLSEWTASVDDATSQVGWRAVRALTAARAGDVDAASLLAQEAVALACATDAPNLVGSACDALAAVLDLAGRDADAADARVRARAAYRAKGNVAALAASAVSPGR